MTFNVSDFLSVINGNNGIQRASHFAVLITPPAKLMTNSITNQLVFYCDSVDLPSLDFQNTYVKHKGYGLAEERPNDIRFGDVTATHLYDGKAKVHEFFTRWASLIMNFDESSTNTTIDGVSQESFGYPVDYWGTVEIFVYDPAGDKVITWKLHKAFPKSIGQVQFGWELNDQIARLPITWTYRQPTRTVTEKSAAIYNTPINTNSNVREITSLNTIMSGSGIEDAIQRLSSQFI